MKKQISIIILTWNGQQFTKQCLSSLRNNTSFPNYEVIVVDNGSQDGTVPYLESLEWIKLIKNPTNEGFVKGNNTAIRTTHHSDIVLLNNDIVINQCNWLEKLQAAAYSKPDIGIVGARLINENGTLLHAGTYIYPESFWGQQIGGGQVDVNQHTNLTEVEGIVFACAYIKREVIETVGLLDEDYFSYFEDTDYCLKARENGYKTVCCGDVTLIHYENISTKVNNVSLSDIFLKSQDTFKRKWARKFTKKYTTTLSWHSIVNFSSGYAMSSRNLILSLDRHNIDVRYKYVYGKGTPFPLEEPKVSDDYRMNIIRGRSFSSDCPQVIYAQGDVFHKNTGKYKIGYTMLEVTGLPKEWIVKINTMDEVWTPSSFNLETFTNSGITSPIYIIPLGVDPDYFNPSIASFKGIPQYVFLSVFEWGERKAPDILLRAFALEFNRKDDVILICKVINNDGSVNVPEQITRLNLPRDHAPIVFVYNQNISSSHSNIIFVHHEGIPAYQMGTFYRSGDCFVLPTRGEGWGMPIMEAMACGLPVIATNWSAYVDFISETTAYPLQVKGLVNAKAKCPYYEGFQWADPDGEHLQYLMRYVYEHRDEARAKGFRASKHVLTNWNWDIAAEKIIERLKAINGT